MHSKSVSLGYGANVGVTLGFTPSAIRLYATWLNKTFAIPAAGVSWKAAFVFNVRYGNLDSDVVRPLWS